MLFAALLLEVRKRLLHLRHGRGHKSRIFDPFTRAGDEILAPPELTGIVPRAADSRQQDPMELLDEPTADRQISEPRLQFDSIGSPPGGAWAHPRGTD